MQGSVEAQTANNSVSVRVKPDRKSIGYYSSKKLYKFKLYRRLQYTNKD